ncbi:MAG: glycine dehydrogenase (aminomethyl-transferring) [Candidatus Raymondbacteria bacterium RifOxyC12_full_50_8]|uniref:Probable glycine dehydrogenase (decarboxylating) subunit 2 n=1 Tax=Candidatus Raymondbacteria bacterium RIFOXYD12_FULL_49_13 TaxID=1817890 RepID=A0A1F7FC22_UNCRA|nr:MAG: glycine dehydrogenase (aminomethyl-transferring) [Candidatus Raymondbacteria bacterium RIFOXYA2_FULL_49_16]OGJ96805.1 MAG: glycine dehydrogenase (aminomethyl-transferring) [Candidatus Raymondbacteria bacterium RifOxyC12_full_50_8]OGK04229.1 MAG: glycine dehydrogenase (aminomethyl-transferring) [Candidatus Raymondbacteria bacterium RIFOXYD12_FULL_49_13]OGP42488.1 MAG: glycine dehydrogenase (aminomethyl-transferring) [Candidatus Raymondbacteria bacterium RIFOXYB2_FULL_49_35]
MKLIFEKSSPGSRGITIPKHDVPEIQPDTVFPKGFLRQTPAELPEVPEYEVVRHYTNLSSLNYHIDKGIYPLGSCTMKHNPKINETTAAFEGFTGLHPLVPEHLCQGALELMYNLEHALAEISGMDAVSLQPAAGAHGELAALMVMAAYFRKKGEDRKYILIPDSAHGTNPASAAIAGFVPIQIASGPSGTIDCTELEKKMNPSVAAIMITNPNTLGLFEQEIERVANIVHGQGGLLYMDGANLNALMGIVKPGEIGFDVMHFNLHKTFSTPHGGGGPGSGPIGVRSHLAPFLPRPRIEKTNEGFRFSESVPQSIGKAHSFYGNFLVCVRAYTYILMQGGNGLAEASKRAIINANYLLSKLKGMFEQTYPGQPLHEFVLSGTPFKNKGVKTLDIAKRMLDYGVYAPTIYFPQIVPEAIMIEPTETETQEELDRLVSVLSAIVREIETDPEIVVQAPHTTPVRRLDEAKAARDLDVCFKSL